MKMFSAVVSVSLFLSNSHQAQAAFALPQNVKQNFLRAQAEGLAKHPEAKPKVGKSLGKFNPFAKVEAHHETPRLTCGITETVGAHTDKYEDCPATCPYFAQNRKDSEHCTFLCVPGNECGTWNPNKPIPDSIKNSKTCRGPKVNFCSQPMLDGTDKCQTCSSGYDKHLDGQCYFKYWTPLIVVGLVIAVILVIALVWVVDLCCREATNTDEVTACEKWRSRSKILKARETKDEKRHIWPLETNICSPDNNIAGPGMMLHFNFQAFFIVWPLCVALVWVALACFHNELFILGTRKFGTPRHNCILVAWGYETQQRLMWTKVLFLAIVYVGSFVSFTWFFVRQLRIYQEMDAKQKTMKDFAVELKGLPQVPGTCTTIEEDIKVAVKKATGLEVVGASVAWAYSDVQETVDYACQDDLALAATRRTQAKGKHKGVVAEVADEDPTANMNAVHKWMYNKERETLGPGENLLGENPEATMTKLLEDMVTSDTAFVVFTTYNDAEAAIKMEVEFDCEKYGEGFGVKTLTMAEVSNEPANLNWHNFTDTNPNAMLLGFFKGFFKVYVPALLVWFFGFYVPYAYSLYYFNYDNGAELPGYYSAIFTIVVCGGNATMYVVCDICCDIIGFRYKDSKQVTYMLMYLCACMINVFLDMVVTYYTAMKVMVGLDFRTYHGTRLADIDTFTEQFETYAMQRSLGGNTYAYAWPSTFFLCFVLEPFVTILIPLLVGRAIVRSHNEIKGTCSEAYMAAFEFDLGRYADILLNVFLGIMIFYFPGGYIWTLFFFMAFSHSFIYCFDHWRVLSVIPSVKIVSPNVDWYAQVTMCFCCAIILACLVFKANCESYSGYCIQSWSLIGSCTLAGVAHFIVHFAILLFVVPKFGKEFDHSEGSKTFAQVAADEPRTWFAVNPIHCLRSKYIHKQEPHCLLASWGKEHLLESHPAINCHFTSEKAREEDYSVMSALTLTSILARAEDAETPRKQKEDS